MSFDFEEKALITEYGAESKKELISELREGLKNTENAEMIRLIEKVIAKVSDMSPNEYKTLMNEEV